MIAHIKFEGNISIMNDYIRCWFQKGHFQGHLRSNKVIIVNRTHFKHSFRYSDIYHVWCQIKAYMKKSSDMSIVNDHMKC